jgi:hypothetical protein
MKTILMTVLSAAAFGCLAQEATPDTWMRESVSTASSADVRAEARQLLASGDLGKEHRPGYLPSVAFPRLRAEVVAELHAARMSGEFARLSAEAHDFAPTRGTTAYAYGPLVAHER